MQITERGARRWGHLSSKATHWEDDLSNQRTMSRLRSWNGVGRRGSRSSTRETGYQWSLQENLVDELSSSSSISNSAPLNADWDGSCSCSSAAGDGGVGGAATRSGERTFPVIELLVEWRKREERIRAALAGEGVEMGVAGGGVESSKAMDSAYGQSRYCCYAIQISK